MWCAKMKTAKITFQILLIKISLLICLSNAVYADYLWSAANPGSQKTTYPICISRNSLSKFAGAEKTNAFISQYRPDIYKDEIIFGVDIGPMEIAHIKDRAATLPGRFDDNGNRLSFSGSEADFVFMPGSISCNGELVAKGDFGQWKQGFSGRFMAEAQCRDLSWRIFRDGAAMLVVNNPVKLDFAEDIYVRLSKEYLVYRKANPADTLTKSSDSFYAGYQWRQQDDKQDI
jgi:hypothetical protein